ncbi:DUF2199 domain-containing protein [Pseudooceanicola sp. HF7]|uniref:DUF2199 domain-containing protein n=1 Tax=Pseudooceanicola sp. HF7 TaxID=2721560 RepID=UPI001430CF8D|nr:DUF2199 domain-containing protein [Pseudooceanicola sp. HF7]NIZ09239.1 DUF2199 domain-containing protein [Pseudooceanicola sp. HF7]
MSLLSLDARWQRFNDPDFRSPIDGRSFSGIYDLGFDAPDDWPHGPRPEGTEVLERGEDRLSAELCRLGEARFLRIVLALPLRGTDELFFMAPWAQVSPADFYRWLDAAGSGETPELEGLLANALPGFEEEEAAPLTLLPAAPQERPRAQVQTGPLAELQAEGLSFDHLLDVYAAAGDDIRPHLTAR